MLPIEHELILSPVETVAKEHSPYEVEVRSDAGHQMPWTCQQQPISITIDFHLHHPCPSNKIPHGNPTLYLQRRIFEQ